MAVAIRFRTQSNSPFGTYSPGQVAIVPEDFATPLLEGGYAEIVEDVVIDPEPSPEAQELADLARDAGFTGEANFQELLNPSGDENDGSGSGDDEDALAAALGADQAAVAEAAAADIPIPVIANFGAASPPAEQDTPGDGVGSLEGGDIVKPTGRRKTGGSS